MLVGVAVTAATPVPLRATVCGLLPPVSVMLSVAVRNPKACGLKVTEIVQVLPAPRVVGQPVLQVKSARLELKPLIVIAVLWPFFNVTFWTELTVPRT